MCGGPLMFANPPKDVQRWLYFQATPETGQEFTNSYDGADGRHRRPRLESCMLKSRCERNSDWKMHAPQQHMCNNRFNFQPGFCGR